MVGKSCFIVLCVALLGHGFLSVEGTPMRTDYTYFPDAGGWLKLHLTPTTFKEARKVCVNEGSVLASPEDIYLEDAFTSILHQYQTPFKLFTGIHDTYASGHYYSLEGTPLSRMPVRWASEADRNITRPNDCLQLSLPAGDLVHGSCEEQLPFLCFMRKTPARACSMTHKDYVYEKRTNSCYKFHTDKNTWSNAFSWCSYEGGHLAIVNSDTEAQVLHELYVTASRSTKLDEVVFLGFTDTGDRKLWLTIHEQTLKDAGYNKWEPGQPVAKHDARCGAMFGRNGKLDDFFCTATRPYICEMNPAKLHFNENLMAYGRQ